MNVKEKIEYLKERGIKATERELNDIHHHDLMVATEYACNEINKLASQSKIYESHVSIPMVEVKDTDCVSAAVDSPVDDVAILNFASYTKPGGGYLNGAWAQEESLCSESNLWEILNHKTFKEFYEYNRCHMNNGLYEDRMIYTPDVMFRGKPVGVLTCASPNYKEAIKNGVSHDEVVEVYRNRLKSIYNVLHQNGVKQFIAGAWGCGVFEFPRELMLEIFNEVATVPTVLAIPSGDKFKNKRSWEE